MANNKSAEKRNRQNAVRNMRNRKAKSTAKSSIKDLDAALSAGNKEEATSKMKAMTKLLDTIAGKGIVNKKAVARKKSRMQLKVNKLLAR